MSGTVITVGSFDGVHLGHRAVLEEIAERARRAGRRSLLVTFEPHPMEVVNPQLAPPLLTLGHERREVLAQCELDAVVFLQFTRTLSQYRPVEFVRMLLDRYDLAELVIGPDHGFGKGRAGDEHVLRDLGQRYGFTVDVVDPVAVNGREVSSTLIRRAIAGGDLETATHLLGRRYSLAGAVTHGAGRGRDIGYRTVNLALSDARKLLPPDGVYAVWAEWPTGSSGAMMHLGPRPTFDEDARTIEAHLLDAPEDLDVYGRIVKLTWIARLRDVRRFASAAALRDQLHRDFTAARAAVAGAMQGHV